MPNDADDFLRYFARAYGSEVASSAEGDEIPSSLHLDELEFALRRRASPREVEAFRRDFAEGHRSIRRG